MDIFTDKHSGVQFCMKVGNPCAEYILENGIYEYNLIKWCEQFLTSKGTFVDIGAHMGTYSIILSKYCKEVHAFEAQKSTFDCLTIGVCVNNAFNIKIHNVALGEKDDTLILHHVTPDGGCSSLRPDVSKNMGMSVIHEESVQVKSLDSFGIKNIDFMKIDVEGYELDVIKGASLTLVENNFPPFIFEAWPDDWYKADRELLLSFVKNLGYKVYPISGCNNMYLASDHPLSCGRSGESTKVDEPKPGDIPKYNLRQLQSKYEEGKLQEMEDAKQVLLVSDLEERERVLCDWAEKGIPWDAWFTLAKMYRVASKHKQSYECAVKGLEASPPEDQEYLLYEEISIVSFYINKKKEGYEACEKVISDRNAPWSTRNSTLSNEGFYMKSLPIKKKVLLNCEMPEHYTASSASIIPDPKGSEGYRVNLRGVNYYVGDNGYGVSRHGDNIIRTINYLMFMDKALNIVKTIELRDNSGVKLYPKNVLGMEDIRLFGDNYFFCSYAELNDSRTPQIGWGTYDEEGIVTRMVPLMAGTELKCEKNWLPFIDSAGDDNDGNDIYIIYALGPFQLYKLDKETGTVKEVKRLQFGERFIDDFRGSAVPIEYDGGWLCTIHQVYHSEPRKYFHRFVWFDRDFTTMKYSLPFFFEKIGVEFNLSICKSEDGLLVTYSVNDASSIVAIVDYKVVDTMLQYKEIKSTNIRIEPNTESKSNEKAIPDTESWEAKSLQANSSETKSLQADSSETKS